MRKALMGLILAATVLSPIAAEAQDWHRGDRGGHGARNQNEGDGNSNEGRAARAERRQERQQQPEAQQAPQPQPQVVERRRGNDGGDRGNWRGNDGGDRGNWRGNDGNRGDDGNRGGRTRNNQTSIYPQAWQGDPNSPQLRRYQQLEQRNQQRYDGRRGDRNDGRNWRNDRRGDNDGRNWRNDRRGDRNWRNDWNRSWRNDRRYDWNRWRYSNRNIFHIGRYYSPYRNYGYNRFDIGFFLEPLFFGRNYWIGDPWQYRLPPAPPGTQWVRYYNDVLLVDVYSGEVIDAIYDFFW